MNTVDPRNDRAATADACDIAGMGPADITPDDAAYYRRAFEATLGVPFTAGEAVYERLLAAGVKLYRYRPTMLHAKVVLLDDALSVVGSANFNHRSMGKDDEIAVTIIHQLTFARLAEDFEQDRGRCEAVELDRWRRRGPWQRLREQVGRLLSPQA